MISLPNSTYYHLLKIIGNDHEYNDFVMIILIIYILYIYIDHLKYYTLNYYFFVIDFKFSS